MSLNYSALHYVKFIYTSDNFYQVHPACHDCGHDHVRDIILRVNNMLHLNEEIYKLISGLLDNHYSRQYISGCTSQVCAGGLENQRLEIRSLAPNHARGNGEYSEKGAIVQSYCFKLKPPAFAGGPYMWILETLYSVSSSLKNVSVW